MSDDVCLGVEQKPIRSAEVLAPTPEHFLGRCLCSSAQLTLSWRVNDSCGSAFQTVSCSNQVSTRQYRPVFSAAPHAAYSLDILTHLTSWGLCVRSHRFIVKLTENWLKIGALQHPLVFREVARIMLYIFFLCGTLQLATGVHGLNLLLQSHVIAVIIVALS